jgi:hypothetical protein
MGVWQRTRNSLRAGAAKREKHVYTRIKDISHCRRLQLWAEPISNNRDRGDTFDSKEKFHHPLEAMD